jgi:hypothetical protein
VCDRKCAHVLLFFRDVLLWLRLCSAGRSTDMYSSLTERSSAVRCALYSFDLSLDAPATQCAFSTSGAQAYAALHILLMLAASVHVLCWAHFDRVFLCFPLCFVELLLYL